MEIEFFDADQQPLGGAIHDSSVPGVLAIVPEGARFWRPVSGSDRRHDESLRMLDAGQLPQARNFPRREQ